jgi:hypothetical protein
MYTLRGQRSTAAPPLRGVATLVYFLNWGTLSPKPPVLPFIEAVFSFLGNNHGV